MRHGDRVTIRLGESQRGTESHLAQQGGFARQIVTVTSCSKTPPVITWGKIGGHGGKIGGHDTSASEIDLKIAPKPVHGEDHSRRMGW
jgi:hypothetical protein